MNRLRKIVIAITLLIIHGTYGGAKILNVCSAQLIHKRVVAVKEAVPTETVAVRPDAALSEDSQPAKPSEVPELEKIAEIDKIRKRLADGDRSALATKAANAERCLEILRSNATRLPAQGQIADSPMSNIQGNLFGVSEWSDGRSVYLKTP